MLFVLFSNYLAYYFLSLPPLNIPEIFLLLFPLHYLQTSVNSDLQLSIVVLTGFCHLPFAFVCVSLCVFLHPLFMSIENMGSWGSICFWRCYLLRFFNRLIRGRAGRICFGKSIWFLSHFPFRLWPWSHIHLSFPSADICRNAQSSVIAGYL